MLYSPNDRDKRLADLWPIRLTLIRCVSLSRVHSSFLACHFRVSASGAAQFSVATARGWKGGSSEDFTVARRCWALFSEWIIAANGPSLSKTTLKESISKTNVFKILPKILALHHRPEVWYACSPEPKLKYWTKIVDWAVSHCTS